MQARVLLALDRADPIPLHRQLHERIRAAVLNRQILPGERLPGSRRLATDLGVSRTVVTSAYDLLLADGFVETRHGSGTMISHVIEVSAVSSSRPTSPTKGLVEEVSVFQHNQVPRLDLDFRPGVPAWDLFPQRMWARKVTDMLRRARPRDVDYGPAEGVPELRAALSQYMRLSRGTVLPSTNIVITSGATQAIDLVARALLKPGDAVVVEEPTHPILRAIFANNGAVIVPVPLDAQGLQVDLIPECAARAGVAADRVRLVYVTPSHQFPTGIRMSLSRALSLLAWCRDHEALVVEDDYDSEYVFDHHYMSALSALDQERAIYVGTFSKTLFPGLRLGFLGLPTSLLPSIVEQKWLSDRLSPTIDQHVLADVIVTGAYARHVSTLRTRYTERRQTLVNALHRCFEDDVEVIGPPAGLHVLVSLNSQSTSDQIVDACAARGVMLHPGAPFYASEPPENPTFLLGYANMTPADIDRGIGLAAQAIRTLSTPA